MKKIFLSAVIILLGASFAPTNAGDCNASGFGMTCSASCPFFWDCQCTVNQWSCTCTCTNPDPQN